LAKLILSKSIYPVEYLKEPDELLKAQKIYEYIRKYYHWNGKYEVFNDFNPKKLMNPKPEMLPKSIPC
jgi:hypothetical protein